MTDIKTDVCRMLERRARDIQPLSIESDPGSETATRLHQTDGPSRAGPSRLVAVGAAMAVVVGAMMAISVLRDDSSTTSTVDATNLATDSAEGQSTSPPSTPEDSATTEPEPPAPVGSLNASAAALPAEVDVLGGPLVFSGRPNVGAEQIARDYLDSRLPQLPYELTEVESVPPLVLYRWAVDADDIDQAGSVIVREDPYVPGVVAATTDQVDVTAIGRTLDRITASVTDVNDDLLVADVTDLNGEILPSSPNPAGSNNGADPIFGTAGFTNTDLLEFNIPVGPIPAVVRIQHLGGTLLSISEFALDAVGFIEECGTQPPINIDVGDLLGPLEQGTALQSTRNPLVNQQVWHHPGENASIQILWPADPRLTSRVVFQETEEPVSFGFAGTVGDSLPDYVQDVEPLPSQHVLLVIGTDAADPCSMVQVSVYGDPAAVEWWTTAISGEWSFGFPLSIAELDPAIGPDGVDPTPPNDSNQLVIGFEQATQRPLVPETGSSDGLPDDPPKTGPGNRIVSESPEEALVRFLANATPIDPPLPAAGYTEVTINDSSLSYVIAESFPYVVIDLSHNGEGWTVDRWTAAPC